jgi:hypothetical protein
VSLLYGVHIAGVQGAEYVYTSDMFSVIRFNFLLRGHVMQLNALLFAAGYRFRKAVQQRLLASGEKRNHQRQCIRNSTAKREKKKRLEDVSRVQWVNHLVPPATPLPAAPRSPRGTKKKRFFLHWFSPAVPGSQRMASSFYWAACARFK